MEDKIEIIGDKEVTKCFYDDGTLWRQYSIKNEINHGIFIFCRNRRSGSRIKSFIDEIETFKNGEYHGFEIYFNY
jgi:hypothetical protein